jgi:hypothetical protein
MLSGKALSNFLICITTRYNVCVLRTCCITSPSCIHFTFFSPRSCAIFLKYSVQMRELYSDSWEFCGLSVGGNRGCGRGGGVQWVCICGTLRRYKHCSINFERTTLRQCSGWVHRVPLFGYDYKEGKPITEGVGEGGKGNLTASSRAHLSLLYKSFPLVHS